jgi:phospho-N-acetylmuramoyl-pentapeptide-transferase
MGDTGAMSLGIVLGIVAMLTGYPLLLPIIGFLLLLESLSVIIQLLSKKFRKRKVFLSAPIHHHFEAQGWPETKIVMRFWVIAGVFAVLGLILAIIDLSLW